jgi:hypothetical protein
MKKISRAILLILVCCFWQGAGYVGTPPNFNDYFQEERQAEPQGGFIDIQKKEVTPPPVLDVQNLQKQLAPADYSNLQLQVLRPVKKPAYYNDLLELKANIKNLQEATKTNEVQNFTACANVQKFYFETYLDKYKNSPQAKQEIYYDVKDIMYYSLALSKQWYTAVDNIQYVSYNSYNGAYQPSSIRVKLNVLDKKLSHVMTLIETAEKSF